MPKTYSIKSLASLRTYLTEQVLGKSLSNSEMLRWLAEPGNEQQHLGGPKQGLGKILVREVIQKGTLEDLEVAIDLGYPLDHALRVAAEEGKTKACERLIDLGFNPNWRANPQSLSPLEVALGKGQFSAFTSMLKKTHPHPTAEDQQHWLLEATGVKKTKTGTISDKPTRVLVEKLLAKFGDGFEEKTKQDALEKAARLGLPETFEVLVEAGASPVQPIAFALSNRPGIVVHGTPVLLLLDRSSFRWARTLDAYGTLDALYPGRQYANKEGGEKTWVDLRQVWANQVRTPGNNDLEKKVRAIHALARSETMNDTLPEARATTASKPRF